MLNHFKPFIISCFALLMLSACAIHQNPYYNPELAHHTPTGFKNPYVAQTPTELELLGWALRIGQPLRNKLRKPFVPPQVDANIQRIISPNKNKIQVTWIGHATFLIQYKGKNILTDPVFSERTSPVPFMGPKRYAPPALSIDELPPIDAVIISHVHYDHLDKASLKKLGENTHYYVPLGVKPWLMKNGIPSDAVTELDWWQSQEREKVNFTLVPARHFANRSLLDLNETLWGGWVIELFGKKLYFAGDTGYSPLFREIGRRYGPVDLSFIPIGAYEPYMPTRTVHIVPRQSVQIHRDVMSKQSIAMHWGTFKLTGEPMDEPPKLLKRALARRGSNHFDVMKIGETRYY